ncbi:hypothetical protein [Alishewanella longhuensis]
MRSLNPEDAAAAFKLGLGTLVPDRWGFVDYDLTLDFSFTHLQQLYV